jgi:cytoskeletal protein CcmA (bactofilin family)
MSPLVATAVLFSLAAVLFVLPLLPALFELQQKRDAKPLNVVQQYAGEIRHFAGGFRQCIDALQQPLSQCVASGTVGAAQLSDGDKCLLLGHTDGAVLQKDMKGATFPFVVAAGVDLVLSPGLTFLKEIYAGGQFFGGEETTYRAILGVKNVHLGRASKITRWAHASGNFQIEHDCDLYGRISCDKDMSVRSGCTFRRLNAPRIALGDVAAGFESGDASLSEATEGDPVSDRPRRRKLIDGDWEIRPGEVFTENIVTRGKLRIGAGAKVFGSVKCNGELLVETGVTVDGSLIASATMQVGPGCKIRGPVIAEHGMVIQSGTQCGTAQTPTTVSAPIIDVEEGSLFFGTLWAREHGRVVPKQ